MSENEASIELSCPYCSAVFMCYREHIGVEFACPSCNAPILIPADDPSVAALMGGGGEQSSGGHFTDAEMNLLSSESQDTQYKIASMGKNNCWECGVIAHLLNDRLEPLRQSVFSDSLELHLNRGWRSNHSKANAFIDNTRVQFFGMLDTIYYLMTEHLTYATNQQDLEAIMTFVNLSGEEFGKLKEFNRQFYREALPPDGVYPDLQSIIAGWSGHVWQACSTLSYYLTQYASNDRQLLAFMRPQISLMPPTMHQFYLLRQKL